MDTDVSSDQRLCRGWRPALVALALLLASGQAAAHVFPPEVHLTLWSESDSFYVRMETASGDYWRSAALRRMFDADRSGELDEAERGKLFAFLKRRALFGLTLRTVSVSEPEEIARRCTRADEVDTAMPVACEFVFRLPMSLLPILRVENAKGEVIWVRVGDGPWEPVHRARNFWVGAALPRAN